MRLSKVAISNIALSGLIYGCTIPLPPQDKDTVIHIATQTANMKLVEVLVLAKADVGAQDKVEFLPGPANSVHESSAAYASV
jgi:hypothetical protein